MPFDEPVVVLAVSDAVQAPSSTAPAQPPVRQDDGTSAHRVALTTLVVAAGSHAMWIDWG